MKKEEWKNKINEINKVNQMNIVKNGAFIALIIAAGLIITDNFKIIGIVILILSLLAEWNYFRCPHCNKALDPRLEITQDSYYSFCGKRMGE